MYNNTGNSVNIFKSDTFGDIDKSKTKLTELFCEERLDHLACLNQILNMILINDEWV